MSAPPAFHPQVRARRLALVLGALAFANVGALVHARIVRRGRSQGERVVRTAARIVGPELASHVSSRWLRHPTRTEPWAFSADGPALMDPDPAGAWLPPPRASLFAGLPPVHVRVTR